MSVIFDTLAFGRILLTENGSFQLPLPAQLANNRIVGFDVQNFSPFDILVLSIPGLSVYHIQPFMGMYIPIPYVPEILGIQPFQAQTITIQTGPVPWVANLVDLATAPNGTSASATVQFTAYLSGDPIPSQELIPYLLTIPHLEPVNFYQRRVVQFISASFADSTVAHTTTLGPFTYSAGLPQQGLYLTVLSFSFLVPAASVTELVTLTDKSGLTVLEWDCALQANAVGAVAIPFTKDLLFPFPGLLSSSPLIGTQQQWNFNTPATAGGPGYAVSMVGYVV